MSNNITESLFQAISTIAEKHVANLKYDKTIICTITDISNAKNNIYTVSDGGITFEAQGDGGSYKVDDNVRVLILEGDYTKTKYIQGKHNAQEANKPITYVSALNSILDLTDNMLDPTDVSKITGITANGSKLEEHIGTINLSSFDYNIANNDIFNTLYIKGEFWSAFDQYEMRSGDYGIHLVIGIDNGEAVGETKRYDRLDLRLSALKDMFGNPYAFKIYTPQEIVCKLSSWPTNAKEIYVYLYQNNNFEHYNYNSQTVQRLAIPYLDKEETTAISNIKVKNVAVGFGSEIASIADNKLKIYTNDTQSFDHRKGVSDSYNKKAIQLLWYNKSEDNEYLGFSDGSYVPSPGYDEDTYLADISTDTRLLTIRDGKNYINIPHDENCLDLQADINEIIENGQAISKIIGTTLWHTLDNFNGAIAGLSVSDLNDLLGTGDTSLIHYQEQLDKDIEYLHKAYTEILEDAHTHDETFVFKDIDDNACENADAVISALNTVHARLGYSTTSTTSYYHIINSAITTAEAAIQEAVTAAAKYQDTYDSYVSSLTRALNKIKKYAEAIHTIYTTSLESDSNNSTRLAALIKFDADTQINIGEVYGSKLTNDEFIANNANKYCIYWYKKDDSSLTTDGIMPAGWSRIAGANNIGLPSQDTDDPGHYLKKDDSALELTFANPISTESVKAVLFYNHEKIISNELTFTNDAEVLTDAEINLESEIIIEHYLNSQDTYQLYNEYGELNNMGDAIKQRKLKAKYSFAGVEDPLYLINTTIYWYVPNQSTLLILHDTDKEGFSIVETDQVERYKDGYTGYYKTITDASNDTIFTYHIKERYQNTLTKNNIICEVVKVVAITEVENEEEETIIDKEETVVHTATQYFNFSAFGNQGTDYTLALLASPGQTCVINDTESPLTITPQLYDYNHNEISLLDKKNKGKSTILTLDGPSNGYELTVEWEDVDDDITEYPIKQCKICKNETNDNYWCMLRCAANNVATEQLNKNINLVTWMPIPYSPENEFYIEGASTIIYSSSGNNPVYYKSPYKLYNRYDDTEWSETISETEERKAAWKIRYYKHNTDSTISYCEGKYDIDSSEGTDAYNFYSSTGEKIEDADILKAYATSFVPRLDKENCLIASNLFIDNLEIYPVVIAYSNDNSILWAQPLLIKQNKHSSAMLNSWDGSLKTDEESNTILTAMVGAGRKNSNNEFEGVLMGDVATTVDDESITTLGLYGYNDGVQSFGFKIDGTAFIGKNGGGRIYMDGNNAFLYSQAWLGDRSLVEAFSGGEPQPGADGMLIDLKNGYIDAHNFKLTSKNILMQSGEDVNTFFKITDNNGKILMHIGSKQTTTYNLRNRATTIIDDNYLRSSSFSTSTKEGLRIDFSSGKITGYNFALRGESEGSYFNLSSKAEEFFEIHYQDTSKEPDVDVSVIKINTDDYYLHSFDWRSGEQGTEIDLENGRWLSYCNTGAYDGKGILLNAADNSYPLVIGGSGAYDKMYENATFKIAWDGSLSIADTAFNVSADGKLWSGASDFDSAPFSVSATGEVKATSGSIGPCIIDSDTNALYVSKAFELSQTHGMRLYSGSYSYTATQPGATNILANTWYSGLSVAVRLPVQTYILGISDYKTLIFVNGLLVGFGDQANEEYPPKDPTQQQ